MKNKEKKYFTISLILMLIAIIIFLFLLIYVSLYPISDIKQSYWLFILLGVAIIAFIIGFIFLKKGNKIRGKIIEEDSKKAKEDIERIYKTKLEEKNKK